MKKIVVIDDDNDICMLLKRFLTKNGYLVATANSGKEGLELVSSFQPNLVITDFKLGDINGDELIRQIKKVNNAVAIVVITGFSDIKMAVNVIKLGAYDYIIKPLFPENILLTVTKAFHDLEEQNVEESMEIPVKEDVVKVNSTSSLFSSRANYITGTSSKASELYEQIGLVAPTNFSIIINGESGSGKEAIAKEIHERSMRSKNPFVAMDCGAISKELAGSELFGHEKGAFTGAFHQKLGHFEMANGGTLFLDEVANLPYEVQISLLRVLQEKKMRRIGGNKEIALDVRIIVASNEDLLEASKKGKFREDLYHRFNEFTIRVPALRERKEDLAAFSEFFLKSTNAELNKQVKGFHKEVLNQFESYEWPGNLRELNNVIRRATLLTQSGELIVSKSLPETILKQNREVSFEENQKKEQHENFSKQKDDSRNSLKSVAHDAECERIMQVLQVVNYNKSKAARLLNIDRKTLYNKMKQFGM